jgi:hypothetical protein
VRGREKTLISSAAGGASVLSSDAAATDWAGVEDVGAVEDDPLSTLPQPLAKLSDTAARKTRIQLGRRIELKRYTSSESLRTGGGGLNLLVLGEGVAVLVDRDHGSLLAT